MSETLAICPLCGSRFDADGAYADHLRDAHELVDEEGVGEPAGGALDASVLESAAAALALPDRPESTASPTGSPDPPDPPASPPPAPPARRRRAGLLVGLALLALAVVSAMLVAPGDDGGEEAGGPGGGARVADGAIGPGAGLGDLVSTTTTTAQPTRATATTPPPPPTTAAPATVPSPPPPAPPTTAPRPTVRATQAAVVSCSRDGGTRTLVYRYVLSGSAADGPHEERLIARGRLVVESVRAPLPGGGSVVVTLEPGPVGCN